MLINSPNISGSLTVTGNAVITGSLTVAGGINATITGSATSASYVEYSNVANKPTLVSGSSQVTYSGLTGVPSGIVSGSSQITYSGISSIPAGIVSGSSQVTYSGLTGVPAGIVSSSTQIEGYSIFATTGSNQFNGSQAVTGSLTVTGQVVAQTLNVQQVTSSIIYSSGSNIFGNTLGNTQQFTGSVSVTGSLTVAGAGTFASSVATGGNITVTANSAAVRVTESGGADVRMVAGGSSGFFGTYSNHPLIFLTNSTTALTLASTGAATFAGALNGTSATFNLASSEQLVLNNTHANGGYLRFDQSSTGFGYIGNSKSIITSGTLNDFAIRAENNFLISTGGGTTRLTIASTGAATFSSSVTALNLDLKGTATVQGNQFAPIDFYNSGNIAAAIRPIRFNDETAADLTFWTRAYLGSLTERMRITSGGNVGIGVTPSAWASAFKAIQVGTASLSQNNNTTAYIGSNWVSESGGDKYITTNAAAVYGQNSGQHIWYTAPSGTAGNAVTFTEQMRLTSGGYLQLSNDGNYIASGSPYHQIKNTAATITVYLLNNNAAGDGLLVNLDSSSTDYYFFRGYYQSGGSDRIKIYSNGNIQNVNNAYGALSDAKLKENIEDATPKLDDLLKVKIRNYNLIGEETKQIGVIAQELEEVFPAMIDESEDYDEVDVPQLDEEGNEVLNEEGEVVTIRERVNKGTKTKSVKYSVFVPILIKAIQEQQSQIEILKTKIEILEQS